MFELTHTTMSYEFLFMSIAIIVFIPLLVFLWKTNRGVEIFLPFIAILATISIFLYIGGVLIPLIQGEPVYQTKHYEKEAVVQNDRYAKLNDDTTKVVFESDGERQVIETNQRLKKGDHVVLKVEGNRLSGADSRPQFGKDKFNANVTDDMVDIEKVDK